MAQWPQLSMPQPCISIVAQHDDGRRAEVSVYSYAEYLYADWVCNNTTKHRKTTEKEGKVKVLTGQRNRVPELF